MNLGQVYHKIKEHSVGNCEVELLSRIGGVIPSPEDIFNRIKGVKINNEIID